MLQPPYIHHPTQIFFIIQFLFFNTFRISHILNQSWFAFSLKINPGSCFIFIFLLDDFILSACYISAYSFSCKCLLSQRAEIMLHVALQNTLLILINGIILFYCIILIHGCIVCLFEPQLAAYIYSVWQN